MKSTFFTSAAALLASTVSAAPVEKRQALTDADILQFALTLEHLENVFYKKAISMMTEDDFTSAGFSADYFNNLKYISHDEEQHVEELTAGLTAAGAKPVAACTYDFGFTDPKSFVTLASVLEGVGSSAYLGAAPAIMSKEYLGIAGSILGTEQIHTAIQRTAVGEVGPANPYLTALGPNEVYTLASAFIKSCPSSNMALPFKAFPTLMATQGIPAAPGITFSFSTMMSLPSSFFVTFVNGLTTTSVPATMDGSMISATIPETTQGQTYVVLTSSNTTMLMDSQVLAGPAIIEVTPPAPEIDDSIM
ncbi:MAG: hypothetical protein M1828_006682 [Chrysothrix sp. TS-e1954]|nr:MAG: hypothetical protein M1828_006682 [Chrysothrix sp. TS-e1954]